jgi:hypothetical protein
MERPGDRQKKMAGYCSTGQSPQRAVVLMEEGNKVQHSTKFHSSLSAVLELFMHTGRWTEKF